jgi:hypothetical protein
VQRAANAIRMTGFAAYVTAFLVGWVNPGVYGSTSVFVSEDQVKRWGLDQHLQERSFEKLAADAR